MLVGAIVPDVMKHHFGQTLLMGTFDDAMLKEAGDQVGHNAQYVYPQHIQSKDGADNRSIFIGALTFGIVIASCSTKSGNMIQKVLLLALTLSYGIVSNAQKHVYEDLLVLYVDEKYDKCLMKAENYTMKDDTRKDPLPYLYMSMSLFEMSKLEKFEEDYPKAFRDALKYAEKFRKKDKNVEFFFNYEDYWAELNEACAEQAENFMDEEKWSKAKRYYDYMVSYHPENPGAWLLYTLAQTRYNQVREAELSMAEFEKVMGATELEGLAPDQKKLLKSALIRYAEYQESMGAKSTALEFMDKGKDLYRDDKEFMAYYNALK